MYEFGFQRASSVEEAARLLAADPEAKLIAGGQTLIPVLKQRLSRPTVVIDLAQAGLAGIKVDGTTVTIGAMTPHAAVANSEEVRRLIPALADLASMIGDEQVRHRGTIGGSLANDDPTADYPAAVLGLNATVRTQRRAIKADDFFLGMFTTALEPDEIITAVEFPAPEKAAYEKFRNPASRYAMVGVFVAKTRDGVRVAVTGAGQNGVFRHTAMEQALTSNLSPDAIANVTTPASDMNSDIHGSAEYRAHLVGVIAKRALAKMR
jgi:aerobic carbon-monoxide dehydrogenase medium subunit